MFLKMKLLDLNTGTLYQNLIQSGLHLYAEHKNSEKYLDIEGITSQTDAIPPGIRSLRPMVV